MLGKLHSGTLIVAVVGAMATLGACRPQPLPPEEIGGAGEACSAEDLESAASSELGALDLSQSVSVVVALETDEVLRASGLQNGLDISLTLCNPQSEPVAWRDSPFGASGSEALTTLAPVDGDYRLVALVSGKGSGNYTLTVDTPRPARRQDLRRISAEIFSQRALMRWVLEDWLGSLEAAEQAAAGWARLEQGNSPRAEALFRAGRASEMLSRPKDAARFYHQALPLWRELEHGVRLGELLQNLGTLEGRPELIEEAIAIFGREGDLGRQLKARNAVGVVLERVDRPLAAEQVFAELLNDCRRSCRSWMTARVLTSLGALRIELGRLQQGLRDLEEAYSLQPSGRIDAATLNNLAAARSTLGDYDEASRLYREALAAAEEAEDSKRVARTLYNLAWVEHSEAVLEPDDRQRQIAALANYDEALILSQQAHDAPLAAEIITSRARLRTFLGDFESAATELRQALELRRQLADLDGEAITLQDLGRALTRAGKASEAIEVLEQSQRLAIEMGEPATEARTLNRLAEAQAAAGNPEAALRASHAALKISGNLRSTILRSDLRARYGASKRRFLETHLALLDERYQQDGDPRWIDEAFSTSDRMRAQVFYERLFEPAIDLASSAAPALLERRRHLLQQIRRSSSRAADLPTWLDQLRALEAEISGYPTASTEAISVARVQRALQPDDTLLEFFLGESRSYLWIVRQNSIEQLELPSEREIERLAQAFLDQCSSLGPMAQLNRAGERLSDVLLPALETLPSGRWILIADGILHRVPFAALPLPGRQGSALLEKYDLVFEASASALLAKSARHRERAPLDSVAIFADPITDRRLPRAGEEARAIAGLGWPQPPRVFLGHEATRANVLTTDLSRYRYLHFATHAVADPKLPELSRVLLSETSADESSWLSLHDIYSLPLSADLVVLSACETGVGRRIRGEGPESLARGFIHAGARQVVATSWNVDDLAAEVLSTRLFGHLRAGLGPASALRKAQLSMRADSELGHPSYWAAFSLYGATLPIESKESSR